MSYLEDVLKKLGWEDGFQIPVANVENQQLEEEVAKLTLAKIKSKGALEASSAKLENLRGHLKHITQESEQNQSLITAYTQQLKADETALRISQAEKDKYESEIKQCEKNIGDVKSRQGVQRNTLEKYTKKLDKLKTETDWDTEALNAWNESLQKRDSDNELIKKFSKQDARKYNELEARRQNLEVEFNYREKTIEKMVNDLSNYERILERTGKIIAQQVVERKALISQWKDAVKILQQRDVDIDRVQNQIIEMQEFIVNEKEKLNEQKQFHNNEIRNNAELEFSTQQLNFLNSKMRRELSDLTQVLLLLHSQSDTLRRAMINAANLLEKERQRKRVMAEEIEKKEEQIFNNRTNLNTLKTKNEFLRKSTISADEKSKHLERMIDCEQKHQKALLLDLEMLQNTFIRMQQDLQEQFNIGKTTEMSIKNVRNNINHVENHNEDQRKVLGKRKEDAYELDFRIDQVQKKILINENVISNEDTEELEGKLVELENRMAEHAEVKTVLKDQVNKIRDDMRRLTTAIAADQDQLIVLKDKLQHQNLSSEGGQKQLKILKHQINEKQVEENILRLRVNELSKAMKKQEHSIYTMKKYKLTLEQATKERLMEIDTNKEILAVKRRNLYEDKGKLKYEISERRIKLDQLKKKYDIVLSSLGKDEDGQTLSVIHFKIKNAQEKFLLQQEGDELDAKIKKAEKEIKAMENTLKIVNLTNVAFKQSLGSVDENGDEINEMKQLENQLLMATDVMREKRGILAAKLNDLNEIKSSLEKVDGEKAVAEEKLIILEGEYMKIQTEKRMKEEQLKRAENCLKIVEKKVDLEQCMHYDRDLKVRQLKTANLNVMQRLTEISMRYQEVAPLITRYTIEYQIKLPEKRSKSLYSSSESTRSSKSCSNESEKSSTSESTRSTNISKVQITFQMNF